MSSAAAPVVLAVDVGGTTIAAGMVTGTGEVLLHERVPAQRDGVWRTLDTTVELLERQGAAAARLGRRIVALGVGVPGPIDVEAGRQLSAELPPPLIAQRSEISHGCSDSRWGGSPSQLPSACSLTTMKVGPKVSPETGCGVGQGPVVSRFGGCGAGFPSMQRQPVGWVIVASKLARQSQ